MYRQNKFKKQVASYLILFATLPVFLSCNNQAKEIQQLQTKIDSLQKQINDAYKPGLGEFMLGIQLHHAKLWFAGQNQNWPLADFEIHEILESLDDIKAYCQDRPEIKAIGMINGPLDSLNNAIQQKNTTSFKNSFVLLTNTCNKCHQSTEHAFNIVTIPANLPVVNQDFKLSQENIEK
jgi:hypothetical protein